MEARVLQGWQTDERGTGASTMPGKGLAENQGGRQGQQSYKSPSMNEQETLL